MDFPPKIVQDSMMTISANGEGIQFEPSASIKAIFGTKLMTDSYHKRPAASGQKSSTANKSGKPQSKEKTTQTKGAKG